MAPGLVTRGTRTRKIPQTKIFRPVSLLQSGDNLVMFELRLKHIGCVGDNKTVGKGEEVALVQEPDGTVDLLRGNQCVPSDCVLLDPSRAIFFALLGLPDRQAK